MIYDLAIVGGGPAGVAAGIYAARKKIKSVLITESFGGQSVVSADIQNWIGVKSISGYDLAKQFEDHLKHHSDIEILEGDLVATVVRLPDGTFSLTTRAGKTIAARFILLALGSRRRKLGVPGEREFDGRGVAYCATCDAPIFKGRDVAVVGGGNAAIESVVDLMPYANKIYLFVRGDALKGDPVTQEKIKMHPNVQILFGTQIQEIVGDTTVTGVRYQTVATGAVADLALGGVFVEIGAVPNADIVKDLVQVNPYGEIIVDHKTQATSCPGIWAAGDVSDVLYKQNNISAGDGIKALLNIYDRLIKEGK